jgi:hypothetical protein
MEQEPRPPRRLGASLKAFEPPGSVALPLVVIECPDETTAQAVAAVAEQWHTGTETLHVAAPGVLFGDSVFRVSFCAADHGEVLLEVWGQVPEHLTCVVATSGRVPREELRTFEQLVVVNRSYTLTIAAAGQVRLDLLHLVKYEYDRRRLD